MVNDDEQRNKGLGIVNLMRTPKMRKDLHSKPNTQGSKKVQQKQQLGGASF